MAAGLLLAAFALLLPAMALARPDYSPLAVCATNPIGSDACPEEAALGALNGLEPEWGYYFRPGGGDAFAIVHLLGTIRTGIEQLLADDCAGSEETAFYVSDTWAMYVAVEPVDKPMAEDLATVEGFVSNAIDYLSEGACQ